MKKLVILFLLIPTFIFCQGWETTIGDNCIQSGKSVQQTIDGGFIIGGITASLDMDSLVYLVKTDNFGNVLWTKTYGGNYRDVGYSVQQTFDGGYIVAGSTFSFGNGLYDVYLTEVSHRYKLSVLEKKM